MIKAGILGASGTIAKSHKNAYAELLEEGVVRLEAYCDTHPEELEVADYARVYSNIDEFIENEKDKLDYVDICLPTFLHKEVAIKAMEAGLDVLCEKPMALNVEDAMAMYETSVRTGRKLMIGQSMRFDRDYRLIRDEYIRGEKLGKVRATRVVDNYKADVEGRDGWFQNPKLSGGFIFDLHAHDVDMLYFLFGKPDTLSTVANYNTNLGWYDVISTNFTYPDGTFVSFLADWKLPVNKHNVTRNFRFNFEKGYVIKDLDNFFEVDIDGNITDLKEESGKTNMYCEIKYFAQCVRDNVPVDHCPPQDTVDVIKTICYEIESADGKGNIKKL